MCLILGSLLLENRVIYHVITDFEIFIVILHIIVSTRHTLLCDLDFFANSSAIKLFWQDYRLVYFYIVPSPCTSLMSNCQTGVHTVN